MENPYAVQIEKLNKYIIFFSEIEDTTMSLMLNIMMTERLENDPWLNTEIRAALKKSITTLMTYINSTYQISMHDDLFTDDKIGDVEEFKAFAREMSKHSVSLRTIMECVAKNTKDA